MSVNGEISQSSGGDRRTVRTRAALIAAFNRLILARGFENISAAEIAEQANVGRSTLYQHFDGKDELLAKSASFLLADLATASVAPEFPPEMVRVCDHLWANRKLADSVFSGTAQRAMAKELTDHIARRLAGRRGDAAASPFPLPFVAAQLATAQIALLKEWLAGRHRCSPRLFAEALYTSTFAAAQALTAQRPQTQPET
jgi:AcrR family transcriptional regulator